jgi:hypothetical protein
MEHKNKVASYSIDALRDTMEKLKQVVKPATKKVELANIALSIKQILNEETLKKISPNNWEYIIDYYYIDKFIKLTTNQIYTLKEMQSQYKTTRLHISDSFKLIFKLVNEGSVNCIDDIY